MLASKTRHLDDRMTLQSWNRLTQATRAQRIVSGTPGLDITVESGGSVIRYNDPAQTRWVFVIATEDSVILCKEAVPIAGEGWRVSMNNADIIRAPMAPNYTREHFERFLISGESQPGETDQVCLLQGGYIVPHYRFRLVDPPDPAQCAECT